VADVPSRTPGNGHTTIVTDSDHRRVDHRYFYPSRATDIRDAAAPSNPSGIRRSERLAEPMDCPFGDPHAYARSGQRIGVSAVIENVRWPFPN